MRKKRKKRRRRHCCHKMRFRTKWIRCQLKVTESLALFCHQAAVASKYSAARKKSVCRRARFEEFVCVRYVYTFNSVRFLLFLCSIFVIDRQRLDNDTQRTWPSMPYTTMNYNQREMEAEIVENRAKKNTTRPEEINFAVVDAS